MSTVYTNDQGATVVSNAVTIDTYSFTSEMFYDRCKLRHVPHEHQNFDICKMQICLNPFEYYYVKPEWKHELVQLATETCIRKCELFPNNKQFWNTTLLNIAKDAK